MLFEHDDPDRTAKLKGFIVLGDATSLKILFLLDRRGSMNFSDIRRNISVNPASLTKKLRTLQDAGLLKNEKTKDNLHVYYSISQHHRHIKRFIDSFEKLAQEL